MHVAITGASSGIGAALVREFSNHGAAVTLVARRRELMDEIVRPLSGRTLVLPADLSCVDRACDWIGPAQEAMGPIDVLINNAGVQIVAPAHSVQAAQGEALLAVDLLTPLRITAAVLPQMRARGAGTIVDVASVAALAPTPGMWHYNAAKAGLAAASEGLRAEVRRSGVHVVTVYPGPVDTAMARAGYAAYPPSISVRLTPQGTPERLAHLVRRAVERRKARVIYPWPYILVRHFPALSRWFLDRLAPMPHEPARADGA